MRLRFGPDDEDSYAQARDSLLCEFQKWLAVREPAEVAVQASGNAGLFLDWRYGYSTGVLDEFSDGELEEFLLVWCPRKLSAPADNSPEICRAVGVYLMFMADTGRLVGRSETAAGLAAHAQHLAPAMHTAMDDPANFGMAKSLFAGLGDIAELSKDELMTAVQARIDEHNVLPFDERRARTDAFFEPPSMTPVRQELPFVLIPPTTGEIEAAAGAAPLRTRVAALRDYLGSDGKALTQKGNLKLADGRALIEILNTGDEMDPRIGDRVFRTVSTTQLPQLGMIIEVAKRAGALRMYRRRLVPTKSWATRSDVKQAISLATTIMEYGPLSLRSPKRVWYVDQLYDLLDSGVAVWLAPLLSPDAALPFGDLVDFPVTMAAGELEQYWPHGSTDYIERFARRAMAQMFSLLEMAGLLGWVGHTEVVEGYGLQWRTGGTVTLTALGRHLLPEHLSTAGFTVRNAGDFADADAPTLIADLLTVGETFHRAALDCWRPDLTVAERAHLIIDATVAAEDRVQRLFGFHLLGLLDLGVVEPLVRQLLDTPVAGHAALWLIGHALADSETVGAFIDAATYVDLLALELDDPDALCESFTGVPDPLGLLDDIWRNRAPETALILDVLGRHLADAALAKAARKAAMRHRSWIANQS